VRLRVVSWNIHKAIGGVDRRYRPDRVLDVLRHYEADVILLQEVDEGVRRSRFHRQLDLLGDALSMHHRCYGANVKVRRGVYGNATFSRYPLRECRNIDLTLPPKKRRGALYTRVRVTNGGGSRTLHVVNLHLGLAGYERRAQLRRLLAGPPFPRLHARTPLLVAGDFNDVWDRLGARFFEPAGFRRAGHALNTFPAWMPARPLDAVWVRGDLQAERCMRSHLELAREASDHLPLIADLDLQAPRAR